MTVFLQTLPNFHKLCTLLVCLFLFGEYTQAQINTGGTPTSFNRQLQRDDVPEIVTQTIDLAAVQAEDAVRDQLNVPYRFAIPLKANYNLQNSGAWESLPNGDRIWRLKITCPGAFSTNFLYSDFYMPPGAVLYIYNADKTHLLGGYTARNNRASRLFATEILDSETAILEYLEPANVTGQGVIQIEQVSYGYRGLPPIHFDEKENGEGIDDSGGCQVNVNCSPEGDNWQTEKKAVARMVIDGSGLCSGTLINNTADNCTPYFLTAEHCIDSNYDAISNPDANIVFYWNFERPGCADSGTVPNETTSGATLVANSNAGGVYNSASDFALFSLVENPADAYDVYFAGFDASNNTGTDGAGIHHPAGDVKMIATHTSIPASVETNRFWRIYWDATANGHSVTEGGSSGSGLFRANGRLIGQLFGGFDGGQPNCTDPAADEGDYGKLSYSWDNNGATDARRRVRDWLDPIGGGTTTTMDGKFPTACPDIGTCIRPKGISCGATSSANTADGDDLYDTHGSDNTWTGNEYIFSFIPNVTDVITIDLTNTGGADLGIFLLSACDPTMELASADAGGAGANEQIMFSVTSGVTYYIMIDGRANGTATFDLAISCPEPPDSCDFLSALNCGDNKSDTNIGARTDFTAYTGATYSYTGPEKIYEVIAGPGAMTVTLTWADGGQDLDLLLLSNCDPTANNVLDESTTTATTESVTTTVPAGGGTYYVVVEGYAGAAADFNLAATCSSVVISPKVYLQAALSGPEMTTNLNTASLIPTTEPYTELGYSYVGGGGETSLTSVITTNDIVDWVVVELRDATDPTMIVASKAGLVKKDGTIVNRLDGTSAIGFPFASGGSYYVAIRHRNHLSVMSAAAITF